MEVPEENRRKQHQMMIQFCMCAYFCDNDFVFCVCARDSKGRRWYRKFKVRTFKIYFFKKGQKKLKEINFKNLNVRTWKCQRHLVIRKLSLFPMLHKSSFSFLNVHVTNCTIRARYFLCHSQKANRYWFFYAFIFLPPLSPSHFSSRLFLTHKKYLWHSVFMDFLIFFLSCFFFKHFKRWWYSE